MNVDFPLVFQGIKTVTDPIASSSWPIAVCIVAWIFRAPIKALIGRIRELHGFGGAANFSPENALAHQQSADGPANNSLPTLKDTAQSPPVDPVFDDLDNQLAVMLEEHIKGGDKIKLAWAIRQRSISEASRIHETHYRLIFGSQIDALRKLNETGTAPLNIYERYYAEVAANPAWGDLHKGRTFEQWGEFLVNAAYVILIEGSEPSTVQITPFGKQFLHWMLLAGATDNKPG